MADRNLLEVAPQRVVDEWAKYAIQAFQDSLKKRRVGVTQSLFNSFKKELQMNGGDVGAVMIKFAMYGRFIDMGVGRGVAAHERKSNRANMIGAKRYGARVSYEERKPKRWYPKVKAFESYRLREILIRDLGENIRQWISDEWSNDVEVGV